MQAALVLLFVAVGVACAAPSRSFGEEPLSLSNRIDIGVLENEELLSRIPGRIRTTIERAQELTAEMQEKLQDGGTLDPSDGFLMRVVLILDDLNAAVGAVDAQTQTTILELISTIKSLQIQGTINDAKNTIARIQKEQAQNGGRVYLQAGEIYRIINLLASLNAAVSVSDVETQATILGLISTLNELVSESGW